MTSFPQEWRRETVPIIRDKNTLRLRHVETSSHNNRLDLFCISEVGPSVHVKVTDMRHYFYVQIPNGSWANRQKFMRWLTKKLKNKIESEIRRNRNMAWMRIRQGPHILSIEKVRRKAMKPNEFREMCEYEDVFKVTVAQPHLVRLCDKILWPSEAALKRTIRNEAYARQNPKLPLKTFETQPEYTLRCMADLKLHGSQWFDLELKYAHQLQVDHEGSCNYVVDLVYAQQIKPIASTEKDDTGPFRTTSFDIECIAHPEAPSTFPCAVPHPKGTHPDDDGGPVVTIGATTEENGCIINHVAFQLGETTAFHPKDEALDGVPVTLYTYEDERELLRDFASYVRWCDPDSLTGYNINKFDIPYLLDREKHLGMSPSEYNWSRVSYWRTRYRYKKTQTRAFGTKESWNLEAPGIDAFDMIEFMFKEYKLRAYGLNPVAEHFLKDKKEDVPYSKIPELQGGTPQDRHLLAKYCVKDAYLPLVLLKRLNAGLRYTEQARVAGIPRSWLLARGQGIRSFSCCLRFAAPEGFIINTHEWTKTKFEGATVFEPVPGFYDDYIAILDFASLYPSIIQAYNICFTTIRNRQWAQENLEPDDYWDPYDVLPEDVERNYVFVKPHIQEGLLPKIEAKLLAARRAVKERMKEFDESSEKYQILDGTQLALKIMCNSLYGYLNGFITYDTRLSQAVTAWGRAMIQQTKELIAEKYPFAEVVYGDTDSVFVNFHRGLAETGRLGKEAAEFVTERLVDPNELELEAIYSPLLIPSGKKRYAFGMHLPPKDVSIEEATDDDWRFFKYKSKGMENVRRDAAPICSKTVDEALTILLSTKSAEKAADYVRGVCRKLRNNDVPFHELIMSKSFSKTVEEYDKSGTRHIHIELVKRMRERDPDTAPRVGSRVQFVVVGDKARMRKAATCELSEDPLYAMKHRLTPNADYYIERQLCKPLMRIFLPVYEPKVDWKAIKDSDKKIRATKTYKLLFHETTTEDFAGRKRIKRKVTRSTSVGLGQWAVVLPRCASCNARLPKGVTQGSYCEHCIEDGMAKRKKEHLTMQYEDAQERSKRLWQGCIDCQDGNERMAHMCENAYCSQLYMRMRVGYDIEDLGKKLGV